MPGPCDGFTAGGIEPDVQGLSEQIWLRNAVRLHAKKRTWRARRNLVRVLLGVLGYLFFISPTVFVTLENPYRAAHGMSVLDWSEGL